MTDRLPALAFGLISVVYLLLCRQIPAAAASMPVKVGWFTLLLCVADLALLQCVPGQAVTHERADTRRQAMAIGGVVLLSAALVLLGLLPAVGLFMVIALRLAGRHRWGASLIGAAVLTLVLWLVFAQLLQLELFPGLLFGGDV
jgi:hypothetical protein